MDEKVRIALVGCGGMGRRHLAGIAELSRTDHANVTLSAVCDIDERKSAALADEAQSLLGYRPRPFTDVAQMAREVDGLLGAGCTTDTSAHLGVSIALLEAGLHTLCEKPLALTILSCNLIMAAAERNGKILSIAENFRRDPINRLVRALLDDKAIGERQFIMETSVWGKNDMFITPWRHMKVSGAVTLDAGVHNADILQYYFGEPVSAVGKARLFETRRHRGSGSGPGGFWQPWAADFPEVVEPTGEDAMFGILDFRNGAVGQWVFHNAGHGLPFHHRMVFGTKGSITAPGDRNGRPIRLVLDDGTDLLGEGVLDYAPSYRLSPVAAQLFGSERPWTYNFDFVTTDRKIIALEYHELAECIRNGTTPEVDGVTAKRAIAMVYSLFESQIAARPVTIAEIESGELSAYQLEIDQHIGLVREPGR